MADDDKTWLLLVGSGNEEYLRDALSHIRGTGLEARLRQHPMVPVAELPGLMSAADVVAYPDGTSMSALEAASCGRAVVMTDLPASVWRANLGVGITYSTGDVASLVQALRRALDHSAELGERGEKTIRDAFSYDHVASLSEEMMQDAIQAS